MAGRSRKEEQERILREKRAAAEVGQLGGMAVATVIMGLVYGLFFSKSKFVRILTSSVLVVGIWWFFGDAISAKIHLPPEWGHKVSVFLSGTRDFCAKANKNIHASTGPLAEDGREGSDALAVDEADTEDVATGKRPQSSIAQAPEIQPLDESLSPSQEKEQSRDGWSAPCVW